MAPRWQSNTSRSSGLAGEIHILGRVSGRATGTACSRCCSSLNLFMPRMVPRSSSSPCPPCRSGLPAARLRPARCRLGFRV